MRKIFSHSISVLSLIFSILILIYVFYRSEFFHNGLKSDYYFKYYLLSFSLIFFSIILFFISDGLKYKIIAIILSVIFSLYIVEILIYLNKKDISNFEIFEKLNKENKDITVRVPPNYFLKIENNKIFPLSGISNVETIMCTEYGFTAKYQSDRYGFNNLDTVWDEDEIEYLIIGDSYAHGDCVKRQDNIAGNLEKLSNKNVLNLGYGGNGPLLDFASLREYLPLVKVKKLLWIYTERNDLSESNFGSELKNDILINYLNNLNFTQNLFLKQDQVNDILRKAQNFEYKSYQKDLNIKKYQIIKLFNVRNFLKNINLQKKNIELRISSDFKKLILLTKKLTDQNNIDLYFVYLPDSNRYKNNNFSKNTFSYDYEKILNYLNLLNIKVIDLHKDLLVNNKDPKLRRSTGDHFTKEGYGVVSKFIFKSISDNKDNN